MSQVTADRVLETSGTTGTGTYALAGAVTGFRAFSAVCANGDTLFYYAEEVDANGNPSGGWETGLGTWSTGNNLARTTVLDSSNAGAAVNWAAGTRRIGLSLIASSFAPASISPAPASDQNDYTPTGWFTAKTVKIAATASLQITGFGATFDGDRKLIINAATDYMLLFPPENAGSSAANRLTWRAQLPVFLLPGATMEIVYDAAAARWRLVDSSRAVPWCQFDNYDDCIGVATVFGNRNTGTSAAVAAVNDGNNTTEKTLGVLQASTGTTATGRAYMTTQTVSNVCVPTLDAALFLCRVAIPTLSNGTQRFQVIAGFHDAASGTDVTDGVYWKYDDAASANFERCAAQGSTRTETPGGKTVTAGEYVWLGIFINANWTRADFFRSDDSVTWVFDGSISTNLPGNTQLVEPATGINKTVGTTARLLNIDVMGYRYDHTRG